MVQKSLSQFMWFEFSLNYSVKDIFITQIMNSLKPVKYQKKMNRTLVRHL